MLPLFRNFTTSVAFPSVSNTSVRFSSLEDYDFKGAVETFFERAASLTPLAPGLLQHLKQTNALIEVSFPIKLTNPETKQREWVTISGWRSQHSHHRLPCKGGIRIAPEVYQGEVEALASLVFSLILTFR